VADLVLVLVPILIILGSLVAAFVSLGRRNRINPRVQTAAPLTWLWRPGSAARAHRRLRRALRAARHTIAHGARSGAGVDGLAECTDDLERHAVALDEQLVLASRFGPIIRRTMMGHLRADVSEVELLAARIATTVVARSALSEERVADVVTRVTERLDALDAAHREISSLETRFRLPSSPLGRAQTTATSPRLPRSPAARAAERAARAAEWAASVRPWI
jgi:hypothetical protein